MKFITNTLPEDNNVVILQLSSPIRTHYGVRRDGRWFYFHPIVSPHCRCVVGYVLQEVNSITQVQWKRVGDQKRMNEIYSEYM